MITLAALVVLATVTPNSASLDEHFVAFRFGSESQDDGNNDLEIFAEQLEWISHLGGELVRDKQKYQASNAAFLVNTMLEVRAMSEQRADLAHLGSRQSAELQRIKDALSHLPFHYRKKGLQDICDYFQKPEAQAQLLELNRLAATGQLGQNSKEKMFDDKTPASAVSPPAAGR